MTILLATSRLAEFLQIRHDFEHQLFDVALAQSAKNMRQPSLNRFAVNDLARKDFFVCLGIWVAIEIACFAVLPALRFTTSSRPSDLWFISSLGLGIGGAGLMACGTQLIAALMSQGKRPKLATRLFSALLSWIGLVGIAFPLMFVSVQIFSKLFSVLGT